VDVCVRVHAHARGVWVASLSAGLFVRLQECCLCVCVYFAIVCESVRAVPWQQTNGISKPRWWCLHLRLHTSNVYVRKTYRKKESQKERGKEKEQEGRSDI